MAELAAVLAELAEIGTALAATPGAGPGQRLAAAQQKRIATAVALANRCALIARVMLTLTLLRAWLMGGNRPLRRRGKPRAVPAALPAATPAADLADLAALDEPGWQEATLRGFATRPIEDILGELRADLAEAAKPPVPNRKVAAAVAQLDTLLRGMEAALTASPRAAPRPGAVARPSGSSRALPPRGGTVAPAATPKPGPAAFRG